MTSPTASPASSDLYPDSEPAGESLTYPSHPHLLGRDQGRLRFKDPPPDVEKSKTLWLGDSKISQAQHDSVCEAIQASQDHNTHVPVISNGNLSIESHKRKREDDAETSKFDCGRLSSPDSVKNVPNIPRISSPGNLKEAISKDKDDASSNHWSNSKRVKLNNSSSASTLEITSPSQPVGLPPEIWQYIFCFVPPVFLGRLLRVNRAFNAHLTQSEYSEQDLTRKTQGIAKPLHPDTVWASSRRRFCPGLPKPMRGLKELDMWRLLRGRHCQVCGELKTSKQMLNPESPWESGPGNAGVRVIWPWSIRICGQCVHKCSEKEVDMLFTPVSALLQALPFAFISPSNHYIPSTTLRSSIPPINLQLPKYYYKPHILEIQERLDRAREFGSASAEEWIKGLDSEVKERMNEVALWEQWEARGGLRKVNLRPHSRAIMPPRSLATKSKADKTKSDDVKSESARQDSGKSEHIRNENLRKDDSQYEYVKSLPHSDRSTPQGTGLSNKFTLEPSSPTSPTNTHTPFPPLNTTMSFQPSMINTALNPENIPLRQQASLQPPRLERSIRDVNEAKANRKAEIERRCAALDPPLTAKVLAHMDSFQAAIKISQPLTDQAWQMLQPRLLSQRAYAERREKEMAEHGQLEYQHRRKQEAQLKDTKESLDREWDNVQNPVRNQIASLADERIEKKWGGGATVTKDNSPQFAADVLLYVRKRFYEETAQDEGATLASRNSRFDSGAPGRMLILENMKWLFDTKIKPLTENFQKELFLCNGCDGNFKFYGLESVVQHYAAKHTNTLSCGPQVVFWRAEWPEKPLFHPKPSVAQADYNKIPPPLITSLRSSVARDSEASAQLGGYSQIINPLAPVTSQFSPAPRKDPFTQLQQHDGHHIPFENQSLFRPNFRNTGKSQDFPQVSDIGVAYPGPYSFHNDFQSPSTHPSQISGFQGVYDRLDPSHVQNAKMLGWREPESSTLASHSTIPPTYYPRHQLAHDHVGQNTGLYQSQVDEMARHARDVWTATSGIKDIPQSVRIFVVIQQMVARFKISFRNEPSLSMFLDGLDHNALMKPIRNQKGLACKVCVTSGIGAGGGQNSYAQLAVRDRCLYHLPQLLTHFKTTHLDSIQPFSVPMTDTENEIPDWKFDMIELPESHLIAALVDAPGMDDVKLELIAKVFPGVFPSPLPRIGASVNAGPVPNFPSSFDRARPSQGVTPEMYPDSPPRMDSRSETHPFSRPFSGFRELSQPAASSEPPGEDEYDPHRPAYLGKIVPPGISALHHRNPTKNVSLKNTESSLMRSKHNNHHTYTPPIAMEGPKSTYNGPLHQGRFSENRIDHHGENGDGNQQSASPGSPVPNGFGVRFAQDAPNRREQHSSEVPSTRGRKFAVKSNHELISEDGEIKDNSNFLNPREQSLSAQEGISEADEFLENLGIGENLAPDRGEYRSTARSQGLSQDLNPQIQSKKVALEPEWGGNVDKQRSNSDLPIVPLRTESVKGKEYREPGIPQQTTLSDQYSFDYRSKPEFHQPLTESQVNRRSPSVYATYEAPSRKLAQERLDLSETIVDASRHGDGSFHVARTSQYRSRSRSPRQVPIGAYYRPRSPISQSRIRDPVYHIHSPPIHSDVRPQRIISYDYPTNDRFEYVEDRRPENHLRQRVEYVPVRVEGHTAIEPSHFIITQPTEMRPQPDYVRLDRGYSGEPMYQRHGQLYHAEPRSYHAPQSHTAPTYMQSYRY